MKEAKLNDKIKVIKGKIEDVKEIKDKSIDVIISEWMGYFLLYESMLDSIITVRDKYLKPGGTIWPNRAQIFVAALEDEKFYQEKVGHWKNVYGFNMKCMQTAVLREAQIDFVSPLNIVSTQSKILDLDLNKMKKTDVNFSSAYSLRILRNDRIHGLVSWFDCIFEDPKQPDKRVTLSTAPGKHGTHWKQTTFYMDLKGS